MQSTMSSATALLGASHPAEGFRLLSLTSQEQEPYPETRIELFNPRRDGRNTSNCTVPRAMLCKPPRPGLSSDTCFQDLIQSRLICLLPTPPGHHIFDAQQVPVSPESSIPSLVWSGTSSPTSTPYSRPGTPAHVGRCSSHILPHTERRKITCNTSSPTGQAPSTCPKY
jgi:hypothetical protein